MAGSSSTNLDAEISKVFTEAEGVDAFEVASLQIPKTGRPDSDSPLKMTFALEEGRGSATREEPKVDDDNAESQVTRSSWVCCKCRATNEVAGSACWGCKTHACGICQSA